MAQVNPKAISVGGISDGDGGSGGTPFEVQDLDLLQYADKLNSVMLMTPDLQQTIVGSNTVGLLKGVEQQKPDLSFDEYDLINSAAMMLGENGLFLPDPESNPITECWGWINPLAQGLEYEIIFGNQKQTELTFRANDDSAYVKIKHVKYANGSYGLEFINEGNIVFNLSNGLPLNTEIKSIVVKFDNDKLYILRIGNISLNSQFTHPIDHHIEIKISNDSNVTNMTSEQYVQIGWADSGLSLRPTLLSGYFNINFGEFTITLDESRPSALLAIKNEEPTQMALADELNGEIAIAVMYMMGAINVAITDNIYAMPLFSVSISNATGLEAITFKYTKQTIEIFNKGISFGSYTHTEYLGSYIQTVNFPLGLDVKELAFNLSNAYQSFEYRTPEHVRDGVYYRLTADAVLFEKELKKDDFIQFFNNASDVIIVRVADVPVLPEPQDEYYRGSHTSFTHLLNAVSNPKPGDYALVTADNKSTLYFYSHIEAQWKALVTETNYRGTYTYLPYVPNSKAGDYILVGYNQDLRLAFFHPYLSTYVYAGPNNADQIEEGNTNKFYTDQKVISLLANLFVTDFSIDTSLKLYFDTYIKRLFLSDTMPVMTTVSVQSVARVDGVSYKAEGIKKLAEQITYESHNSDYMIPSLSTAQGAIDLFKLDIPPFKLSKAFWYINFDIKNLATIDSQLHLGVMINGSESDLIQPNYGANIYWILLNYSQFYNNLACLFNEPNRPSLGDGAQRVSLGYKNGSIYMIGNDGVWSKLADVTAPLDTHNDIKFFIKKISGNAIALGNIHAVIGEVFKIPTGM